MATTWTRYQTASANLSEISSLVAGAVLPVAFYMLVNLAAGSVGIVPEVVAPFGLPAWIVGGGTMLALTLSGMARWLVIASKGAGRVAGWWITAFIGGIVLLPFALLLANPSLASLLSMLVLLTGIIAAVRASALSALAGMLLLPGLLGLGVGSLVGFTTLAGGWSPPFGLIDHNKH